jgi:Ca2+/H+ antiporter
VAAGEEIGLGYIVADTATATFAHEQLTPLLTDRDLHFRPLEVVAVVLSVDVVLLASHDGEANWLEGAMRALAFYNVPP